MASTVTKIGVSIDTELYNDIIFYLTKVKGVIEPNNSMGKFFNESLRPLVPKRNVQVTNSTNNFYDSE